jgi:hypothetical protein
MLLERMLIMEHYLVQECCQGISFGNESNTCKRLFRWMQSRQMQPRQNTNAATSNRFVCECSHVDLLCMRIQPRRIGLSANAATSNWIVCECSHVELLCMRIQPRRIGLNANAATSNWFVCECSQVELLCMRMQRRRIALYANTAT